MFLLKKHRKIASKKTAFTLRFAVFSFLLWFPLKSFLPAFSLRLMFTQLFPCIFFEKSPYFCISLSLTVLEGQNLPSPYFIRVWRDFFDLKKCVP